MNDLPSELRGLPLDHVAIAVNDLDSASQPYLLLGLEAAADELLAEQGVRVRMLQAGTGKVELIAPTGRDSALARFLEKRGAGLHHLALRVEEIEVQVERLKAAGARFTSETPREGHGGSRVIFLHPSWTGGVLLELVERE